MTNAEREQLRREATLAALAIATTTAVMLSGGRGTYVIAAIAVACVAWRIGFEDGARTLRNAQERDAAGDSADPETPPRVDFHRKTPNV